MAKVGLFVRIVAKAGKENEVSAFLASALPLAEAETGTLQWFAIRLSKSDFAIFDTFTDEAGRQAHLKGPIALALMEKADELLAQPPKIEQISVLACKIQ
ncbi:MAG: antibiotic biosynthesis monooxygenase [Sandaracinaceae bacterium]|nr:antibiotic biosynthesis monooxygenase [Sandaracinaceae bacterium]